MDKQELTKLANELKPVLKRISAKRRFLGFKEKDVLRFLYQGLSLKRQPGVWVCRMGEF